MLSKPTKIISKNELSLSHTDGDQLTNLGNELTNQSISLELFIDASKYIVRLNI